MSTMPCSSQIATQAGQEPGLRHDVAALALDGLHDDGRDLVRGHEAFEQHVVEPAQVLDPAEGSVVDARQQRAEARRGTWPWTRSG